MYCTQCGARVLDGDGFCAQCGSALSAGEAGAEAAGGSGAGWPDIDFKSTRIMNMAGVVFFSITTGALFFNKIGFSKIGSLPTVALVTLVVLNTLLIAVPVTTLFALSDKAGKALRRSVLGLNAFIILLWVLSVVGSLWMQPKILYMNLSGALVFAVPEWINIRALRTLLKSMGGLKP